MSAPVVGFAGLTHLGLVSALALASKGFRVVGYDGDAARVRDIAAGRLPVVEPGLDELARGCAQRISFSSQVKDLGACDLVYISTDVPTDDRGESDLSGISASIGQVIASLSPRALLVVLCQVPPGFTRALPLPSERLFYQVETLVFGRAVERATRPERYIVGCADPAKPLPEAFAAVLGAFGCPILPMRYESAELAKIAINCCLVASVTIANTLAELSERIGADWREIVPALKLDARIGQGAYLAPGLGIAGGNLERDLDHRAAIAGDRFRGERHPCFCWQQSPSPRLGDAGAARGGAQSRRADRHPRPRLQGKHPFDEELAVAGADLDARAVAAQGLRPGGSGLCCRSPAGGGCRERARRGRRG